MSTIDGDDLNERLKAFKLEGDLSGGKEIKLEFKQPEVKEPEPIYFSPLMRANSFEELNKATKNAWFALKDEKLGWMLFVVVHRRDGHRIQTRIPFNELGPRLADDHGLIKWGIVKLGVDVWALTDSLNVIPASAEDPNYFHGYLVLLGVPEVPVWVDPATQLPIVKSTADMIRNVARKLAAGSDIE